MEDNEIRIPESAFEANKARASDDSRLRSGAERKALRAEVEQRTQDLEAVVQELRLALDQKTEAEIRARRQLSRLQSLARLDGAVASGCDRALLLDVLLDETLESLYVDAAAVYTLSREGAGLSVAADRGFEHEMPEAHVERASRDLAVCSEEFGRIVMRPTEEGLRFSRETLAQSNGFTHFAAVPMIAKNEAIGVLEVFCQVPPEADDDWHEFLMSLAGKAALGISLIRQYEQVSRTNQELRTAYDSMLKGWVSALEMRDYGTEGHTLRVTLYTERLAQRVGVEAEKLQNIRRGALLHDIGKIGIPDSILLKPGGLSPEEEAIMQKHPTLAYQWLNTVSYLRDALEIPYCHHEHWDGSGYPRGLAGEEIPLSARIFAVVDVWDALSHDRPYRRALPQDEVRDMLRELAGKNLDPEIVSAFLAMLDEESGGESLPQAG